MRDRYSPVNDVLPSISENRIAELIIALEKIDRARASFTDIRSLVQELFLGYSCLTRLIECHQSWRARKNIGSKLFTNVSELWYPKPSDVKRYGRVNQPGDPIFYVSASHQTSLLESRPVKGELVTILEIHLKNPTALPHVMELGVAEKSSEHKLPTTVNLLENTQLGREFLGKQISKNLAIRSFLARELVKIIGNEEAHQFKVTAAIASILLSSERIDGLEYPSIAGDGSGQGGGVNLAIKPYSADRLFKPYSCFTLEVLDITSGLAPQYFVQKVAQSSGISVDGSIIWS